MTRSFMMGLRLFGSKYAYTRANCMLILLGRFATIASGSSVRRSGQLLPRPHVPGGYPSSEEVKEFLEQIRSAIQLGRNALQKSADSRRRKYGPPKRTVCSRGGGTTAQFFLNAELAYGRFFIT